MCILALCTRMNPRWPLVLIHNRDELFSRSTTQLHVDKDMTLWATDVGTGGSWFGLHIPTGRVAALTNCRRATSTAMPLEDLKEHCKLDESGRLMFVPDASRGVVVRDYLLHGTLPPQCPHHFPVLDGYNLITLNVTDPERRVQYTTNRYDVQHNVDALGGLDNSTPSSTLALANSFLNNKAEPKTNFLRESLAQHIANVSMSTTAEDLIHQLGGLLCSRNGFDVQDMDVLTASKPFAGLSDDDKANLLGRPLAEGEASSRIFQGSWSVERERLGQRDVFVSSVEGVYGTRTQTVLLVEARPNGCDVVHVAQRDVTPDGKLLSWQHERVSLESYSFA